MSWRQSLHVAFLKGYGFINACDCAMVPCDCLDTARNLWRRWDVNAALRGR